MKDERCGGVPKSVVFSFVGTHNLFKLPERDGSTGLHQMVEAALLEVGREKAWRHDDGDESRLFCW